VGTKYENLLLTVSCCFSLAQIQCSKKNFKKEADKFLVWKELVAWN